MHLFDRSNIDESIWEELEEVLIAADVGMETAEKLIAGTKARVKSDKLQDGLQVREALKNEMVAILNVPDNTVKAAAPPEVVLVIGSTLR
jgi:fused signal recognition particle receptor